MIVPESQIVMVLIRMDPQQQVKDHGMQDSQINMVDLKKIVLLCIMNMRLGNILILNVPGHIIHFVIKVSIPYACFEIVNICNCIRNIYTKARRKYFKGVSRMTYQAAQTYCQAEGGSLATIVTELDWVAAKSVCESSKCWLGLQGDLIINDKMIWSWPDGSAIEKSYGFNPDKTATKGQEPWDTRQPSQLTGSIQACVIMYDYGLYHNMECDRLFIPLCTVNNGAHSQRRLMDILFDVEDQNGLNIIEINEDILHQ